MSDIKPKRRIATYWRCVVWYCLSKLIISLLLSVVLCVDTN